jgi:ABC-type polysaccharide/polyol phosphate export permease
LHPNWLMVVGLTPVLLLLMALLGLGTGILVSSLTTKYRDLTFLLTFGVQLAMYATPVIYPMSNIPAKYRVYIELNPMSAIIETFRSIYLGPSPVLVAGDFKDFSALAGKLKAPPEAVSAWVTNELSSTTFKGLVAYAGAPAEAGPLEKALARELNDVMRTNSIYTVARFAGVTLRPETQRLLAENPSRDVRRLNRQLLEDAYPGELTPKGSGIPWAQLGVSAAVTLFLLLAGIAIFNKVEKTFMDTV